MSHNEIMNFFTIVSMSVSAQTETRIGNGK